MSEFYHWYKSKCFLGTFVNSRFFFIPISYLINRKVVTNRYNIGNNDHYLKLLLHSIICIKLFKNFTLMSSYFVRVKPKYSIGITE